MTPYHLDAALSDEMREVREAVHRFAVEVMRPAAWSSIACPTRRT